MGRSSGRGRRSAFAAVVCCAVGGLAGAGCEQQGAYAPSESASASASAPAPRRPTAIAAAAAAGEPLACVDSGAHGRHLAAGMDCTMCHPSGVAFSSTYALSDGTPIASGTFAPGDPPSCSVACHGMGTSTPPAVAWAPEPLACTSCHAEKDAAAATSRHAASAADTAASRAACEACHATTAHLAETRLVDGDGATHAFAAPDPERTSVVCTSCHDGAGRSVSGAAPVAILPAWTDPAGDFHGARAGSGFGGTLVAPYVRGQGPLPCEACHDAHSSGNPFLVRASVNGAAVGGIASRGGVGAETLCTACHAGARHSGCTTSQCHTAGDPAPGGRPCLFCHGHEGIVNFPSPYPAGALHAHRSDCTHCHGEWMRSPEAVPPVIVAGSIAVTAIGPEVATISWTTDERSSSWVELEAGGATATIGSGALVTRHAIALGGLAPATSYRFRVRSSDAMRNVVRSEAATFTTSAAP